MVAPKPQKCLGLCRKFDTFPDDFWEASRDLEKPDKVAGREPKLSTIRAAPSDQGSPAWRFVSVTILPSSMLKGNLRYGGMFACR
jgi:hypothetical protein